MLLGIEWAGFGRLWMLPFFLIAIGMVVYRYRVVQRLVAKLVNPKWQHLLLANFSKTRQVLRAIFLIIGLGSLFLALLQPRWGEKSGAIKQEGRELLVLLDVSRSMLGEDLKPNRLEFAKQKVRALLSKMAFDRAGLVLFFDTAYTYCPMTADFAAFEMFLRHVKVETLRGGTTAIDAALLEGLKQLSDPERERKNKLMLLLTDGEDFSSNLTKAKKLAKDEGVTLYAIGVGTAQGAPVPILNRSGEQTGFEKERDGRAVLSKLDEKFLENLCREFGGAYERASYNNSDIAKISSFIRQHEKEKLEDRALSHKEERYPWLLAVSFVFFLLEWII